MLISKIEVKGVHANATKICTMTTGMVGAKVQFTFDSCWDGLSKTAVFRCMDITIDVLNIDSEVTIPHEVLVRSGSPLYAGVYGTNADGDLVIPTRWATVGIVYSGADPSGDPSTERSPDVWEQLQAQINKLREQGVDDATIAAAIEKWLEENPIEGTEGPDALPNPHKLTFTGAVTAEYDGSKKVTVNIPHGGGGIEVTGAEVGQTIVVKAVDENGKPTEWECADIEKKTKLITIVDITAENDIVLSKSSDTDDLTFGDAVVGHSHYFYKTPEGKQLRAKRIYGYVYSPIAVTGSLTSFSPYYADGDPTSWMFGDFAGNYLGMGEFCNSTWSIAANQYHVFEASADMIIFGFATTTHLNWRITLNRNVTHKAIDHQFPHISGVKLATNMTLPAGTKFVIKAEVEDDA